MRAKDVSTAFSYWSDGRTAYRLLGSPECVEFSASRDGVHWRNEGHFSLEERARPAIAFVREGEAVLVSPASDGSAEMERLAAGESERVLQANPEWYETAPSRGAVWTDPCVRRMPRVDAALWAKERIWAEYMAPPKTAVGGPSRAFWAARTPIGRGQRAGGCIATGVSTDAARWMVEPPLYAPGAYETIRWPHAFALPRRATALFSTPLADGGYAIRYAAAKSMDGPFFKPDDDLLCRDARAVVQTIPLGARRLAYFLCSTAGGLRPTRASEIATDENGRPSFRFLTELTGLCRKTLLQTESAFNEPELLVRLLPRSGRNVAFEAMIETEGQPAGMLVRSSASGRDNTTVWLDFQAGRVSVRSGVRGRLLAAASHHLRPLAETRLMLWAEDDLLSVYIDDELAVVSPATGRASGAFGIAAEQGRARFGNILAWELEQTGL